MAKSKPTDKQVNADDLSRALEAIILDGEQARAATKSKRSKRSATRRCGQDGNPGKSLFPGCKSTDDDIEMVDADSCSDTLDPSLPSDPMEIEEKIEDTPAPKAITAFKVQPGEPRWSFNLLQPTQASSATSLITASIPNLNRAFTFDPVSEIICSNGGSKPSIPLEQSGSSSGQISTPPSNPRKTVHFNPSHAVRTFSEDTNTQTFDSDSETMTLDVRTA
jgi:hypothetical protein